MDTIKTKSDIYVLSDKGRSFFESNYDYVDLHRHINYNISLYEFNRNRFSGNRRRTFNAYTLVSQRIYKNCVHSYYHMMIYDYTILYEIALSEHLYDIALESYLTSLYLRSCCLQFAQYYSNDYHHLEIDFSHEIIFTVKNASPVAELGKYYNSSFVDNIYNNLSLPPSFLSNGEFKNMVAEMIESTAFNYNKYKQLIILRSKKYSNLK